MLPRRSYGSIPHDSSPHRSGLPPLWHSAFSGARRAELPLGPNVRDATQRVPTGDWVTARRELDAAVASLRRAGSQDHIPRGLLTRAWLRFLTGDGAGAQADLDEAWEIAERGPMKLFMADIHLYRARLWRGERSEVRGTKYPWGSPEADLAAASKLINECGYHRRDGELADAKQAMGL